MQRKNHIRTYTMFPSESATAAETLGPGGIEDFVAQDDITIIGFELGVEAELSDTAMNADGAISVLVSLTPNAVYQKPGELGQIWDYRRWTGIMMFNNQGPDGGAALTVMFPAGTGYDMDAGESLSLVRRFENASADAISIFYKCILHYVRR